MSGPTKPGWRPTLFRRAAPPPPASTTILDRFGRPLQPGDLILLLQGGSTIWQVMACTPILDPQAPGGLLRLSLRATWEGGVQGGQPFLDLVKVRDAHEGVGAKPAEMTPTPTLGPELVG